MCSSDSTPYEKVGKNGPVSIADEVPFEIPESWEWARIGSVFNLQAGKNITSADISDTEFFGSFPCYGGNGLRGYVDHYNRDGYFPLIGRQGALCGNINFAQGKFYATEHAVVVESFGGTDVTWAGLFLEAMNLNQYATATAQPGLAVANINKLLIPIPPVPEQIRIVVKFSELIPYVLQYDQTERRLATLNEAFPEQLKKSILQLAVQGKLVPQDPDDEPASVLLERIRTEKERLIKEGKIKRDKNESVIYKRDNSHYEKRGKIEACIDEEIPFDIPENWEWMRLSSFGVFSSGKTPSMSDSQNWNGGTIPWVSSKDMKRRVIEDSEMHITTSAAASMKIYPAGTLLLVARSGILRRLLPLCVLGVDSTINQDIKAFDLYDLSLSEWLSYAIKAFEPMILHDLVKSVTTVESLKFDEFSKMLIPVPPLNEQKRIIGAIHTFINLVKPLYNDPLFSL